MPVSLAEANFQDIVAAYYESTGAARAARYLQDEIDLKHTGQLAVLLRDYREREVDSPTEIELRADVDDLMICCDILEIAIAAGFIGMPNGTHFWVTTNDILENPQVQQYYMKFYPLKLPQLLRFRLRGLYEQVADDPNALVRPVMQFLAMDKRFMKTLNDGYLLRMLDAFEIKGIKDWDFEDIVKIVGQPEEFVRRILLPPEKRDIPDQALHEFSLFLQFSFELHALLNELNEFPLIRSEMWSHYGYWFEIIGDEVKDQLGIALSQFLNWTPGSNTPKAAGEIQGYVRKAQDVLAALTSPTNALAVDSVLKEIRTSNPENGDKRGFVR